MQKIIVGLFAASLLVVGISACKPKETTSETTTTQPATSTQPAATTSTTTTQSTDSTGASQ